MDWVVALPYEGLSNGLPMHFIETTWNHLQELPVETRIPAEEFADVLIARTGLTWGAKVESAQTILRWAVYRMVVYILGYLGMAEIEHREDTHALIVSGSI